MEDRGHSQADLHSEMSDITEISSNVTLTSALTSRNIRCSSAQNNGTEILAFPLLKLPAELRVRIYSYLLHARGSIYIDTVEADSRWASKAILRRHFLNQGCNRQRVDFGKMVTYSVTAIGVHPAILSVNRQLYSEATQFFYSKNYFQFSSGSGTIIPFLEDRSEGSRRLIKRIGFTHDIVKSKSPNILNLGHLDHIFEEVCTYLNHSLQLEHMTLLYFNAFLPENRNSAPVEEYLSNIDKQGWVQQLVPLVKHLKTFKMVSWNNGEDNLMLAGLKCLESTMDKTSREVCQTQTVQELAHGPVAPGVQHGLGV